MASGLSKMSLVVSWVRVVILASGLSKMSLVVSCVRKGPYSGQWTE